MAAEADRWVSDFLELVGRSRLKTNPSVDWGRVEEVFETGLPRDYKKIVDSYGAIVVNSLRIDSPRWWAEGGAGWLWRARDMAYIYSENRDEFPDEWADVIDSSPFLKMRGGVLPFHPARPGVLRWGDDGGAHIYWLTEGDPDDWSVVVDYRDEAWEHHDMSTAEFLVKAITGNLETRLLNGPLVVQSPIDVAEFPDKRRLVE